MSGRDLHRWNSSSGIAQILDELRPYLYGKTWQRSTQPVCSSLLRELQQAVLYLQQQMTHRTDNESLQADLRRVQRDNAAIRNDCDRKLTEQYEHEAAALKMCAEAGVTNDRITAQIAHERDMRRLASQRADLLEKNRDQLLAMVDELRRRRPEATLTVGQLVKALERVVAGARASLKLAEAPVVGGEQAVLFEGSST